MKNQKQHYLPQCYLKNFSEGGNEYIWTYNKIRSKKYIQSISNAGQKDRFYTISEKYLAKEDERLDPNFIETDFFARDIEPKYASLLTIINARHDEWKQGKSINSVLNLPDKQLFAALLGIQYLRMPYIREKYWNFLTDSADKRLELIKSWGQSEQSLAPTDIDGLKIHYNETWKPIIHSTFFSDQQIVDDFQAALLDKFWQFLISEDDSFYTSDRPMMVKPHLSNQPNLLEGFKMRGVEIIFPLASGLILTLWDREHFHEKAPLDNKFSLLEQATIRRYNIMQYCHAEADVYAKFDNFDLIEGLKSVNNNKEFFLDLPNIKIQS